MIGIPEVVFLVGFTAAMFFGVWLTFAAPGQANRKDDGGDDEVE